MRQQFYTIKHIYNESANLVESFYDAFDTDDRSNLA